MKNTILHRLPLFYGDYNAQIEKYRNELFTILYVSKKTMLIIYTTFVSFVFSKSFLFISKISTPFK